MSREEEDRFETLADRVLRLELLVLRLVGEKADETDAEFIEMKPGGEFSADYDSNTRTTSFSVLRDDRTVILKVSTVVDDKDQKGHEESSIVYGIYGPSLKRVRAGWRGERAYDTSERTVSNATVEDLIAALQWLIGKAEMPPKAVASDGGAEKA